MSMSNYEANPIGTLQERFQCIDVTPIYRVVQADGASHARTFVVQAILKNITSTGTGSSKQQARQNAARSMLDKLDGRVAAQDSQQTLTEISDSNDSQAPTSLICTVAKRKKKGSKKVAIAKRQAAQIMVDKLKGIGSGSVNSVADNTSEKEIIFDALGRLSIRIEYFPFCF